MVGRNTGRGDFAWHISGRAECGVFPGSDLLRIDLLRREIFIVCLLLDVLDDRGWSSVGKIRRICRATQVASRQKRKDDARDPWVHHPGCGKLGGLAS